MKRIISVFLIALAFNSFSQSDSATRSSLEQTLTTRVPDCQDIYINSKRLFKEYYSRGHLDSIGLVLDFLKNKCSKEYISNDEIILYSLLNHSFADSLIDSSMFVWAEYNQNNPERRHRWIISASIIEGNKVFLDEFYKFKVTLFDSLSKTLDTNSIGYLLSLYYSEKYDLFYFKLRHRYALKNSRLKQLYDRECKEISSQQRLGVSFAYWQPTGKLNIFGARPEVGGYLGVRLWKIYADIFGCYRIGDSFNKFTYIKNDSSFSMRFIKSSSLGLELGFEAFRKYKNQIDILFGTGFEVLSLNSQETNLENKDITTLYYSPGIGYRYYIGKYKIVFINPQIRFVFPDNFNKDIKYPDLSGNTIILRLVIGFSDHLVDYQKQEALRYFDRYYEFEKTL